MAKTFKVDPRLKIFYTQKREKMYRAGKLPRLIRFRTLIHPIVINSARLESVIRGRKVTVVNDSRSTRKGTFVYACSHVGWDDIQMIYRLNSMGKYVRIT